MSDFEDDFMADDEDYDLEYSEDSNSGKWSFFLVKSHLAFSSGTICDKFWRI